MLCAPRGVNTAVRVEFMARHVPPQAGILKLKQVKILKLFSCHSHVSIARQRLYQSCAVTLSVQCGCIYRVYGERNHVLSNRMAIGYTVYASSRQCAVCV